MENMFRRVFSPFTMQVPVVKAEEDELVDPQIVLRDECSARQCTQLKEVYDTCNARVLSKKKTTENCAEELLDFMECVDHCVAKTLFSKLK